MTLTLQLSLERVQTTHDVHTQVRVPPQMREFDSSTRQDRVVEMKMVGGVEVSEGKLYVDNFGRDRRS